MKKIMLLTLLLLAGCGEYLDKRSPTMYFSTMPISATIMPGAVGEYEITATSETLQIKRTKSVLNSFVIGGFSFLTGLFL